MELREITKKEYDLFNSTNNYRSFYQTSSYGTFMTKNGFNEFYLGLFNESNQLCAASLFLFKTEQAGFSSIKYAYAPRGFVIDYSNFELLKVFTEKLKTFLKDKKFTFLRIDPPITLQTRLENATNVVVNNEGNRIFEDLKFLGYRHLGFNLYFETDKPRCNAITYNKEDLFNSFNRETKNKIRNAARKGLTVYKGTNEDLPIFYEFVKNFNHKSLEYYQNMYDSFNASDMIDLYIVKMDINKCLTNMKELYENEEKNNAKIVGKIQNMDIINKENLINKKIASDNLLMSHKSNLEAAVKIANQYGNNINVGAALIIKYQDEISFYISGYDKKFNMPINHILRWAVMNKYSKLGYKRFNLNAVSGDFSKTNNYYGLLKTKLGFNTTIEEYVGELDLVFNQTNYQMYLNSKTAPQIPVFSSLLKFKK